MKLSLNWIKEYVDIPKDLTLHRISHDLTMTTVEVEALVHAETLLKEIYIGQVIKVYPLKNTRKLSTVVCKVGKKKFNVVCGAKNLTKGMMVPIALPGAKINFHGKKEIDVEIRNVEGITSEAVICAATEVFGLENMFTLETENEILDLSMYPCTSGQKLADFLGWDDVILDIDNKSLTNRPDLWGHYGVAREIAAIYGKKLKKLPKFEINESLDDLSCKIGNSDICRRFVTTQIENVKIERSPFWMRSRLAMLGYKCINLFVDLTNYVMLSVGQPSHVYDYNKINLPIEVRQARPSEKITLLDGKKIDLIPEITVVADSKTPVSLAGIMGGIDSSITKETSKIIYECANFHPFYIRRSANLFNVRTESSSRYEKSLDSNCISQALGLFQFLLSEIQPEAKIVGIADVYPKKPMLVSVRVSLEFLYTRLGLIIEKENILNILKSLGFLINDNGKILDVVVPSWRATGDISIQEDLVEEIARLYGYEKFPYVAPVVKLKAPVLRSDHKYKRRISEYFAFVCGMQEIITYPWTEERMLKATGFQSQEAVDLDMPPTPDLRRLRTSLIPNMIKAIKDNLRYFPEFRIFELGRIFIDKKFKTPDNEYELLPEQPYRLSGAIVGADAGKQFLFAKGVLENMWRVKIAGTCSEMKSSLPSWADPIANIELFANNKSVGIMALVSPSTMRKSGLKHIHAALFEIDIDSLINFPSKNNKYKSLPKYPQVEVDFSLLVPIIFKWQNIRNEIDASHELICETLFIDEYHSESIPLGTKAINFRLVLGSLKHSLTSKQIQNITDKVADNLKKNFGALYR